MPGENTGGGFDGGGFLGVLGDLGSMFMQNHYVDQAREDAQTNRDWQFMMSNTAHQREVSDLKAAGLNPMLSAMKGGASTPTPNAPSMGHATSMNSAGTAAVMDATVGKLKAETDLARAGAEERIAQADSLRGETDPARSTMGLQGAQAGELGERGFVHQETVKHLQSQIDQLHRQGRLTDAEAAKVRQEIGESSARELEHVLRAQHLDLDLQRARNEADAQLSWWKKNVAPYLSDAGRAVSAAGAVGTGVLLGRRMPVPHSAAAAARPGRAYPPARMQSQGAGLRGAGVRSPYSYPD